MKSIKLYLNEEYYWMIFCWKINFLFIYGKIFWQQKGYFLILEIYQNKIYILIKRFSTVISYQSQQKRAMHNNKTLYKNNFLILGFPPDFTTLSLFIHELLTRIRTFKDHLNWWEILSQLSKLTFLKIKNLFDQVRYQENSDSSSFHCLFSSSFSEN